jgi:hypothetical protein
MDLEFHQLDRRYDALRVRQPARERRLLASLAEVGQQMPIVVVTRESQYLVVDGHERVRCLHRLHRDTVVDVEGYVNVHGHRYSVPYGLIGRQLEVRETKDRIDVYQGPRLVATHAKALTRTFTRVTAPEHRPPRGARPSKQPPPEEQMLARSEPPLRAYTAALKQRAAGRGTLALRRLLTLSHEYPRAVRTGTEAASSARRTSSTTCTRRWLIARPGSSSTA